MIQDDDAWLDTAIAELLARPLAQVPARQSKATWALRLIRVLKDHPDGLARRTAIDAVRREALKEGVAIAAEFDRTIQYAFNSHNALSSVFRSLGMPANADLFYPVGGKRSGIWGLHQKRAADWVRKRS
jgi:hypothetical protein